MANEKNPGSSRLARSWDAYWRGIGGAAAFTAGGVSHPALLAFWSDFFHTVKRKYEAPDMIDLASGNGAVAEKALEVFAGEPISIHCVDISGAAIVNIEERFPGVHGLVCDVCSIPAETGGFDVVTSQFGVEYAGTKAIDEAARLLAPGGVLALMLHHGAGSIHKECRDSLEAIRQVQASRFIPLAAEMFDKGFKAVRGADRAPYDAAAAELAPAVQALEELMKRYGEDVAGDTVAGLYRDVGRIHGRMQNYDPEEVKDWLNRMDEELEAYAGRMATMSESALDADMFNSTCEQFSSRGYDLLESGPLHAKGEERPLAWILMATR